VSCNLADFLYSAIETVNLTWWSQVSGCRVHQWQATKTCRPGGEQGAETNHWPSEPKSIEDWWQQII